MIEMENRLAKNAKISLAMTGRNLSKKHIQKLAIAKMGTTRTDKTKAKIKQTMLGDSFNHYKKDHPKIPKTSNSRSHLTATDVKMIRDRYSNESSSSIRKLAKEFNVSRNTIHSIVAYKLWI